MILLLLIGEIILFLYIEGRFSSLLKEIIEIRMDLHKPLPISITSLPSNEEEGEGVIGGSELEYFTSSIEEESSEEREYRNETFPRMRKGARS